MPPRSEVAYPANKADLESHVIVAKSALPSQLSQHNFLTGDDHERFADALELSLQKTYFVADTVLDSRVAL